MRYNAKAHSNFCVARAEYLRANGWLPVESKVPGAPTWWLSPHDGREMLDEYAANEQEHRDNDQEHRDHDQE